MTGDELITRGAEAEQARDYVLALVSGAKDLILDRLINLAPDQTLLFTIYKSQLQCLDDIPAVVESDIRAGREAIDELQGGTPATAQNGIL